MTKKTDLLKELGWSDDLIRHFMVEDSEYLETTEPELVAEIFDSHSMRVTFNSENTVGTSFVVRTE